MSLLEIEAAAVRLGRRNKAAGQSLRAWAEGQVLPAFEGRVLPIDVAVARRRATLPYSDTRDGILAATALEHGMTLVTRNAAAFRAGRVKVFNPVSYTPEAPEDEDLADWGQAGRAGPLWLRNLFVRS